MPSTPTDSHAATSASQEAVIAELIVRHRPEIDRISILQPKERERELLRYDVNPGELAQFHQGLIARSRALEMRDAEASGKTVTLSWSAFGAALAATAALRKKISDSPFVQGAVIFAASVTSGLAAYAAGLKLFSGRVRKESKALAEDARFIFERELAIAIENKLRSAAQAVETPASPADDRSAIPPVRQRDASYAVEASAAKAAAASGERTY